jgi:predicted metallopeptidase
MASQSTFDFSARMHVLCADIAARLPQFRHVRMDEVAVTWSQARNQSIHGLQARLTPLRFEGGAATTVRRGQTWAIQRYLLGNVEVLYLLTFFLPRFLNQTFREKMVTVMHELYHINPSFNGDIRRLQGHCHVHSRSQKKFDRKMGEFVDQYLALSPPERALGFLHYNHRELQARMGTIIGLRVPVPKLLPLAKCA